MQTIILIFVIKKAEEKSTFPDIVVLQKSNH